MRDCYSKNSPNVILHGIPINTSNWHIQTKTYQALRFYRPEDGHFEFANTCEGYPLMISGNIYLSAEHYFQCESFGGHRSAIGKDFVGGTPKAGTDPTEAAHYARTHNQHKLSGWTGGKSNQCMRRVLDAKFNFDSYPLLAMRLLKSLEEGYQILVEDSDTDRYWGSGWNNTEIQGKGENKLGIMLMEVRASLQRKFDRFNQTSQGLLEKAYQDARTGNDQAYRTLPSQLGFTLQYSQ